MEENESQKLELCLARSADGRQMKGKQEKQAKMELRLNVPLAAAFCNWRQNAWGGVGGGKRVFLVLAALQISLTLRLREFNFLSGALSARPLRPGACRVAVTVRREGAAPATGEE